MKSVNILLLLIGFPCIFSLNLNAQGTKPAMTFDEMIQWKRISKKALSSNGNWIASKEEPWVGDATVTLYNAKGEKVAAFSPASQFDFTSSGDYTLVTETPSQYLLDSLKLKKTKKDKFPKNKLVVHHNLSGHRFIIDSLKNYKIPTWGDWIAYQRDGKDSILYLQQPDGNKKLQFSSVIDYKFPKEGNILYYATSENKNKGGVYTVNPVTGARTILYEGNGQIKKIASDTKGNNIAFLLNIQTDSTAIPEYAVWLSVNNSPAKKVAEKGDPAFPENWIINEYTEPYFSENGERLFFATSPRPLQKDSSILDEYYPKVHIWHWQEEKQYTQQLVDKDADLKKGYLAVYNLPEKQIVQLANAEIPDITLIDKGNTPFALLTTTRPYALKKMWEGRTLRDIYTVDLMTGNKEMLKKGFNTNMHVSPAGKYAYWYNPQDSSWYAYSFNLKKETRLSDPFQFKADEEDNDVPDYPDAYGIAGWTAGDKSILIYDKYDIWQFDPEGKDKPVNLTVNGRTENKTYRLITLDKEKNFIDTKELQLLSMFDYITKGSGYYSSKLAKAGKPKQLLAGNYLLKGLQKAKNSDAVIYTAETFEQFPDILLSDLHFKQSIKITDVNPQQSHINWGTAELIKWTSLDGTSLEGVVYKPENFDSSKKYPLLVNFYERNADTYHSYRMPEPHRSTIDYHFYTSNEYIIFNPDVRYQVGHPGQSAYNCIIPGINKLLEKGYIDKNKIGAQGHSWGGYQVADLATRTTMFAAIESGAPVVNMFSAYGGIRWGSGLNRSFQYEHGQSRIGKNPWEAPELYKENSPLFQMDKVQTPILIMANDKDGHVPWYQGIEYFVALKRLEKPVWLLNYTGEPHWPMRMANRIDFQKRMYQFFEHYLNNQPMPTWMKEGVPTVKQEFILGYD